MGQVVYIGLCLLSCLLFSPSVEGAGNDTVEARYSCPRGAFHFGRNCYEIVRQSIPWEQAEVECQMRREGGHLVSLLSSQEERIFSFYLQRQGVSRVWIGLCAVSTGWRTLGWEWSNGDPYYLDALIMNRRSGPGAPIAGNCIAFSASASPEWTQYASSNCFNFVCKYKASY